MSTAAKAKEALELSYVEYKQCKSRVSKALGSSAQNERALSSKMQQLSDALSKLNVHHTAWVSKANLTDEQLAAEKYSPTWLEKEWDEVDDLQDTVDELNVQNLPRTQLTEAESISISCSQMETVQSDISSKLTQLLHKTAPSQDSDSTAKISLSRISAYKELLASVKSDLEVTFTTLADKIMLLDKANTAAHCKAFEHFRREQQSIITTLHLRLAEAD